MKLSGVACRIGCCAMLMASVQVWADGGRYAIYQKDVPYHITQSGSYKVQEDLAPTSGVGAAILVYADNVWLDLGGYEVRSGFLTPAIYQPSTNKALTVANGTVRGQSYGIEANGSYNRFVRVRVEGAFMGGIKSGQGTLLNGCAFADNALLDSSSALMHVGEDSMAVACRATGNESDLRTWTVLRAADGFVGRDLVATGNEASNRLVIADLRNAAVVTASALAGNIESDDYFDAMSVSGRQAVVISGCALEGSLELGSGGVLHRAAFETDSLYVEEQARLGKGAVALGCDFKNASIFQQGILIECVAGRLTADAGALVADSLFVGGSGGRHSMTSFSYVIGNRFSVATLGMDGERGRYDGNETTLPLVLSSRSNLTVRNAVYSRPLASGGSGDHVAFPIQINGEVSSAQPWANFRKKDP